MTLGTSVDAAPRLGFPRVAELTLVAVCVAQASFLALALVHGHWLILPEGGSPDTDFVNVWAAGRLVQDGQPFAAYDWTVHKAAEEAALGHAFPSYYPWFYPPPFLFAAALVACFPYVPAFVAWLAATLSAYVLAIRVITGHAIGILVACAFPAVLTNAMTGQNGCLSAALMGGALHLMERRPALAGALIGLLTYKPHLGLLFPLVLAASGRWRTFAAAALVTVLVAALSWLAFGSATWEAFWRAMPVLSQAVMTDGRGDFGKVQSVYALIRNLGGGEPLAWALHAAVVAVTAAGLVALWRSRAPFELKAAALAVGALLVTPYLYIYDLVVLAVPIAFLVRLGLVGGFLPGELPALALAGLLIAAFLVVNFPAGLIAIGIVAALTVRRLHAVRAYGRDASALPASDGKEIRARADSPALSR
jgi:arabinofuranan 3-O-arabinosyltransferase